MPNEKNWHYKHNIDCNGGDDLTTGQNWMLAFYTFMSGGADGANVGAWEIVSASNGTSYGAGGSIISAPGDFSWDQSGSAHSWFLARKNILPISTTNPFGSNYIYLTVDCSGSDDAKLFINWDHTAPADAGSLLASPARNSTAYYKTTTVNGTVPTTIPYRYAYDAGLSTYFNGAMDETGSFYVHTSRTYVGQNNYPFSLCCFRLETPRSAEVDPYPIFTKTAWTDEQNQVATQWESYNVSYATTTANNQGLIGMQSRSGQALWDVAGLRNMRYGNYCCMYVYGSATSATRSPNYQMAIAGSVIDNTYPRLPVFVGQEDGTTNAVFRGRIPDLTTAPRSGANGTVVPQLGTPTACQIGDYFFPATASFFPGD